MFLDGKKRLVDPPYYMPRKEEHWLDQEQRKHFVIFVMKNQEFYYRHKSVIIFNTNMETRGITRKYVLKQLLLMVTRYGPGRPLLQLS